MPIVYNAFIFNLNGFIRNLMKLYYPVIKNAIQTKTAAS